MSPTGVCHWITRGINRKDIFRHPKDYFFFLDLARENSKKFDTLIYHYCLMTNHIHMLICTPSLDRLIQFSQYLKRKYAYYQSKEYKISGATFERTYRSKPVDKDVYLLECARYIDRNPLRAGLVNHPRDYPYGSYRIYTEGTQSDIITPSPAYLGLANQEYDRRKLYADYVLQSRPQEEFSSPSSLGL